MELYRAIVPANHVINDNHGQHYRIHMGNIEWLTWQYNATKDKGYFEYKGRGRGAKKVWKEYGIGFDFPSVSTVERFINDEPIIIRCEIWKPGNLRFDPHNYAKTMKAPIDLLVHDGFIKDDNWKFVKQTEFAGGGVSAWEDDSRMEERGDLPKELTLDWWREQLRLSKIDVKNDKTDMNHVMIRILIKK